MYVHAMRVYAFEAATLAGLIAVINKFASGQAVTNVETGTVAYSAGEAKQKNYVTTLYQRGAAEYSALVIYTE